MIPLNLFVSTKSLDALSFQSLFLGCPLRILPHQNLTPRNYLLPGASPSLLLFTPFLSTLLYNPPISTDLLILFSPSNPSPFNPSQISPPPLPTLAPRKNPTSLQDFFFSPSSQSFSPTSRRATNPSKSFPLGSLPPNRFAQMFRFVLSFLLAPPSLCSPRPSAQIHKSPGLNSSIRIISVFRQPSFLQIRGGSSKGVC